MNCFRGFQTTCKPSLVLMILFKSHDCANNTHIRGCSLMLISFTNLLNANETIKRTALVDTGCYLAFFENNFVKSEQLES
jgi:hypothetical protein